MSRRITWQPPTTPFTWANVEPLGVTRTMIHDAAVAGRITRLRPGVYVATGSLASEPVSGHLQAALAHQLVRRQAIASHHTAALAWVLDVTDTDASAAAPPTFIRPASANARSESSGSVIVHVRDLPRHHRVEHPSGLLVTSPARTAVDVAAGLHLPDALVTLDAAARLALHEKVGSGRAHYTDERAIAAARGPLLEAAEVAATQFSRQGLTRSVALADPRRESALESLSFGHMVAAGLPLPSLQVRITTPMGDVFPDFLWAAARVIGEADGMLKYASAEDLHKEKRRQELLEQMGYHVVRWGWADMYHRPASVLRRLQMALEAASGR